jgi:hypothetical protein
MKQTTILILSIILITTTAYSGPAENNACPEFSEAHQKLYEEYQTGEAILKQYAYNQGFRGACEQRLVALHEMVHVDSAIKEAYFDRGKYVVPYLFDSAWTDLGLTNWDVLDKKTTAEYHKIGSVVARYLRDTPDNHLGNIVDELNAYGQTLLYTSPKEKGALKKQIVNLKGHLAVVEVYLRLLEEEHPKKYVIFTKDKAGRVLRLMCINAWKTLAKAGVDKDDVSLDRAARFIDFVDQNRVGWETQEN